jgi:hypothetical protein
MSEIRRLFLAIAILLMATRDGRAERINQEGRILGPAPQVTTPTLFNTSTADAIVSAMQIMPVTNPWNEDISQRPRLANSDAMIAQIKSDLSPTRQTLRAFYEMNYVLVPDNQPRLTIPFLDYPDESDLDGGPFPDGKYPIPPDSQDQAIVDTGLAPANDSESAIVATLQPGNYTAIMNGKGDTTGVGLIEVYELDSTARLLNISTRGFIGQGDNVMIAGLILNGTDNGTICLRALGPSLAAFGVQGVIADPRLDLFDAQGTRIGANNNWKDAQQNAIQSAGLAPGNDTESALLTDLAPGNYTAIVSGAGGATGVALVEAYHLP